MANIGCLVAATIALLGSTANAAAEDRLKIVIDERGPWNLAALRHRMVHQVLHEHAAPGHGRARFGRPDPLPEYWRGISNYLVA